MSSILGIVMAVVIFEVIIVIHEFGHFIAAKKNGVKVNEFAIGMGPALFKKQGKETLFALRVFPIGGYCAMEGEDEESDSEGAFSSKSTPAKIVIVIAGIVMNLLLGFVLTFANTCISGPIATTTIAAFKDDAVSVKSGLAEGDKIVSMNGMRIFTTTDISYQFSNSADGIFDMTVIRDGQRVKIDNVQFLVHGENLDKIYVDFIVVGQELNPLTALSESSKQMLTNGRLIYISLFDMIRGKYSLKEISGPVGIVKTIDEVVESRTDEQNHIDWGELLSDMLYLGSFISTNIGLFNLLPLPALDGGRLVFLLVELVRRKPVDQKYEAAVHLAGMAVLMGLMVVITVSDITKLFR